MAPPGELERRLAPPGGPRSRPHATRASDPRGARRRGGPGSCRRIPPRRGLRRRHGWRPPAARRRRGPDGASPDVLLLARLRGAIRQRALRPTRGGGRTGRSVEPCRTSLPRRRGSRGRGGGRAADGRGRVPRRGRPSAPVGRDRRCGWRAPCRREGVRPGRVAGVQPRLEHRRPCALSPGREPQGSRRAVRLPGHLHAPPVGARDAPAPPARPGAARVRRRGQQGAAALAAAPGPARHRELRVAEGDGGRGRDLPSASMDAARGPGPAPRCPRARAGRHRRPRACRVEGRAAAQAHRPGHRRHQAAGGPRTRRAPRLQDGRDARRRDR